jgi:hypothetical protein
MNSNLHVSFFQDDKFFYEQKRLLDNYIEPTVDRSEYNCSDDMLAGIVEQSPLSILYFSKKNIDLIQKYIKYFVFKKINYRIGNQNEQTIKSYMREAYLEYYPSLGGKCVNELLHRLNNILVNIVVKIIVTNISQQLDYIKDSESQPELMNYGKNDSIKGQKAQRSVMNVLVGNT